MPKPLISGCCYRPVEQLHSWGQSLISHQLQELNYVPPWKILTIARGLHPHSTCTLRTVNINQYYWDTVTWGTVKSLKLLGFLKNIKAGRDVSSWVSEAFPAPLKTKGDVKKNSCIGISWAGRSSMPMQHSPSSLQAADGEQYCHLMLQDFKK